jgi:hypothetical protein
MTLEEGPTHILIKQSLEPPYKELFSALFIIFLNALIVGCSDGPHVDFLIELQRVLVHGIHIHEVGQDEEKP